MTEYVGDVANDMFFLQRRRSHSGGDEVRTTRSGAYSIVHDYRYQLGMSFVILSHTLLVLTHYSTKSSPTLLEMN